MNYVKLFMSLFSLAIFAVIMFLIYWNWDKIIGNTKTENYKWIDNSIESIKDYESLRPTNFICQVAKWNDNKSINEKVVGTVIFKHDNGANSYSCRVSNTPFENTDHDNFKYLNSTKQLYWGTEGDNFIYGGYTTVAGEPTELPICRTEDKKGFHRFGLYGLQDNKPYCTSIAITPEEDINNSSPREILMYK
jgi:hypothetical protein